MSREQDLRDLRLQQAQAQYLARIEQDEYKVLEEELRQDQTWIDSSKVLYEAYNTSGFQGSDEEAAQFGLDEMSNQYAAFYNADPWSEEDSLGLMGVISSWEGWTDAQKLAFSYMFLTYEEKDPSVAGFGRALRAMSQDPSNLASIGGPLALFGKTSGRQAARMGFKLVMRDWLKKHPLLKMGAVGAIDGGAVMHYDDKKRQELEAGIAGITPDWYRDDEVEEFDLRRNLEATAKGSVFGYGLSLLPAAASRGTSAYMDAVADLNMGPNVLGSGVDPTPVIKGITEAGKVFVGVDVRAQGLPSQLLIEGNGEKPTTLIPQAWGPQNARTFANIDAAKANNPSPLTSTDTWIKFWQESAGGNALPAPPYRAIEYMNNPQAIVDKLSQLRPELKAAADEGFGHLREIANLYNTGTATPQQTGNLFAWAFLSRGAGPYQQEGAYADLLDTVQPYIEKAINGQFSAKDLKAWKKAVATSIPEGSPGRSVIHNANALGTFLQKVGTPLETENGRTALAVLHDMMSDGTSTTAQIRRKFFEVAAGAGIDTKVFSFALLYRGDVFVMDRIQGRHFWDDGTFEGANIYDGIKSPTATGNQRSEGLVSLLGGPRGVAIYEMLEEGLSANVAEAYKMMGREADGSLARFHWESWLVEGNQAVDHGSLRSIYDDTPGTARVREGKPGNFKHGSIYMNLEGEKVVLYPTSTGTNYEFTPAGFDELIAFIKKPKNGIIPSGFKVSMNPDKSPRLEAWFDDPDVNRQKLDEAIERFGSEWTGPDVEGSAGFIQTDTSDVGRQSWRDYAAGRGN